MSKTLLLFGFEDLPAIAAADSAAKACGAEIRPVLPKDYHQTLGALSGVRKPRPNTPIYAGGTLGGRLIVFCGLGESELDVALRTLRERGIGPDCYKAVLTAHNRDWSVLELFRELQQERLELGRMGGRA